MTKIPHTSWFNSLLDKWISGLPMDLSEDPASEESALAPDLESGEGLILPPPDATLPPAAAPRPRQGG